MLLALTVVSQTPNQLRAVARTLREEGVTIVWWTPPGEQRGAGEVLDTVTADYVVMGAERLRRAAVAKARERLRGRGTVEDDQRDQKK